MKNVMNVKLGINIDHAATLRNARSENDPSLLEVAFATQKGGADSLTMHLREDRRHIRDQDIFLVKEHCKIPVNLEMAATPEMLEIALRLAPKSVCLVPEKRSEITTEGGLDIQGAFLTIKPIVEKLVENKIDVFMFVEPDCDAIQRSQDCGATGVEVHTGAYARASNNSSARKQQLERIYLSAEFCDKKKVEFHAGHGLNYNNVQDLLGISNLVEVNIGHAILARAILAGMENAVQDMKKILMGQSR